jgi:hypothetical protein
VCTQETKDETDFHRETEPPTDLSNALCSAPACALQRTSVALSFSGRLLFGIFARATCLVFIDLITFVAADSDLTSLQQRRSSLKEVIQPHLPVRLPCYDFTPLTGHSFGASVPYGFGQRLREHQTRVM